MKKRYRRRTDGRTDGRTDKVGSRDPPDPKTNSDSQNKINETNLGQTINAVTVNATQNEVVLNKLKVLIG